jgi:hypothetical protein
MRIASIESESGEDSMACLWWREPWRESVANIEPTRTYSRGTVEGLRNHTMAEKAKQSYVITIAEVGIEGANRNPLHFQLPVT